MFPPTDPLPARNVRATAAPQPRLVGFRLWPKAIPQFEVGHYSTLDGAREAIAECGLGGLVLAGNYVHGVALGKCIEGGYDTAREVREVLEGGAGAAAAPSAQEEQEEEEAAAEDEELFV